MNPTYEVWLAAGILLFAFFLGFVAGWSWNKGLNNK